LLSTNPKNKDLGLSLNGQSYSTLQHQCCVFLKLTTKILKKADPHYQQQTVAQGLYFQTI